MRTHARNAPSHLATLFAAGRLRPVGLDDFSAMAARSLVTVTGKAGTPLLTDRVLRSYRDSLQREAAAGEPRVLDVSPDGLPLGVRALSLAEMEDALSHSGARGPRLSVDTARGFNAGGAAGFLHAEKALLQRVLDQQPGREPDAGLADMLEEIEHAWVHFPDRPDGGMPSPGFLARVRVAAGYYLQRIARIESVV
jgi:hypothetical protein